MNSSTSLLMGDIPHSKTIMIQPSYPYHTHPTTHLMSHQSSASHCRNIGPPEGQVLEVRMVVFQTSILPLIDYVQLSTVIKKELGLLELLQCFK